MKFEPPQFEMSESGKAFQKALAVQFAQLYDIIDKLTAERDEARRRLAERAMDDLARLDAETRLVP
jgi:hypothetical protein